MYHPQSLGFMHFDLPVPIGSTVTFQLQPPFSAVKNALSFLGMIQLGVFHLWKCV